MASSLGAKLPRICAGLTTGRSRRIVLEKISSLAYDLNMSSIESIDATNKSLKGLALSYLMALRSLWGEALVAVVLFGSVARREAGASSDIDMLIVASNLPRERTARYSMLEAVDEIVEAERETLFRRGLFTDISPLLKTPEEARRLVPLYFDMLQDAEILYEKEEFFSAVLKKLQESFDRLGARRIKRGLLRYWELKPDYVPSEEFTI